MPDDCRNEVRRKETAYSLITHGDDTLGASGLSQLINPDRYSSSHRLFQVTALVLRFLRCLRSRVSGTTPPTTSDTLFVPSDLDRARLYWIRDSQSQLQRDGKFSLWRRQLGLFTDESGVWRCGGRMSNSCLSPAARTLILLDKKHHLTTLIVADAHRRVMHDGVKEMLTELRSTYWLIRGDSLFAS